MTTQAHAYTWRTVDAPLPPVEGEPFEGHVEDDVIPALELVDNGAPTGRILFTLLFPYDDSEAAFVKAGTKTAHWVCFGTHPPEAIDVAGRRHPRGSDEYQEAYHDACVAQAKAALIDDHASADPLS